MHGVQGATGPRRRWQTAGPALRSLRVVERVTTHLPVGRNETTNVPDRVSRLVGRSALLGLPPSATLVRMTIKARVNAGRLVVDEPTDLPEGTEVELLPLDPGDWLDEADRTALHVALRESNADVAAGRLIDADEILRELRSR